MSKTELNGFREFFISNLKSVDYYSDEAEMLSDIDSTISNMEYDMKNGSDLTDAFDNACQELYVDPDGIEAFI